MQLIRKQPTAWDPFRELEELSHRFNRLLALPRWAGNGDREALAMSDWSPACDIAETDKEYRIRAELPDLKREDVHVTLENRVLTIHGERQEEREERGLKYHRREVSRGTFVRRFSMPADADESKVNATFRDGMLNVVVGRAKTREAGGREIEIH